MFNLKKKFSINDVVIDRNIEDKDFAIMELYCLAEGQNSHRNPISREVLTAKENVETFKGKFVIGKYDKWTQDVRSHEVQEDLYGYISVTEDPQFKTKIVDGKEKLFVVCKAYISKIYCKEIVDMFQVDNKRSVSCEFSCALQYDEDEYGRPLDEFGNPMDIDNPILAYSISGVTLLSKKTNPSVKGADAVMKRFSEDSNKLKETQSKGDNMEENKNLSEQPKDENEDIIMEEVKEFPKDKEKDDNVEEMSDAKTEETSGKTMGCDGEGKEMSEKKFAIDLDGLWAKIYDILKAKYPNEEVEYKESIYRIYGIYEEDGQKFVVLEKRADDTTYKANIAIEDEKITLSDELVEIKIETKFVPIEQVREFAEDDYKEFAEKLFSCEPKDIVEQVVELKKFMDTTIKTNTEKRFSEIMVEPKLCLGEKAYNVLFEEGKTLTFEELDNFETKVKAFCEDAPKKQEKNEDELLKFASSDTNDKQEYSDVWSRIANS